MQIHTIQNQYIKVGVSTKGAELQEIYGKEHDLHYLWSGDAVFWGKKSPVLFPIVGGLKNNSYTYEGKIYQLPRHGFARDMEFELTTQTDNELVFTLRNSVETLNVFPFEFTLNIYYFLEGKSLRCSYRVKNTSQEKDLWCSIGAHPAFHVPLLCTTAFEDWFLEFGEEENAPIYPLTKDGLIKETAIPYLQNTNKLPLKKELFYGDALVFKNLKSQAIKLKSDVSEHGLNFTFSNFPYFGIWAAKDAPFVCLEPWCGIADSENTSGELKEKEGINKIEPSAFLKEYWQVEVF